MDGHPPGPNEIGRRPTMRDVAAVAGVSLKTVSRVIPSRMPPRGV